MLSKATFNAALQSQQFQYFIHRVQSVAWGCFILGAATGAAWAIVLSQASRLLDSNKRHILAVSRSIKARHFKPWLLRVVDENADSPHFGQRVLDTCMEALVGENRRAVVVAQMIARYCVKRLAAGIMWAGMVAACDVMAQRVCFAALLRQQRGGGNNETADATTTSSSLAKKRSAAREMMDSFVLSDMLSNECSSTVKDLASFSATATDSAAASSASINHLLEFSLHIDRSWFPWVPRAILRFFNTDGVPGTSIDSALSRQRTRALLTQSATFLDVMLLRGAMVMSAELMAFAQHVVDIAVEAFDPNSQSNRNALYFAPPSSSSASSQHQHHAGLAASSSGAAFGHLTASISSNDIFAAVNPAPGSSVVATAVGVGAGGHATALHIERMFPAPPHFAENGQLVASLEREPSVTSARAPPMVTTTATAGGVTSGNKQQPVSPLKRPSRVKLFLRLCKEQVRDSLKTVPWRMTRAAIFVSGTVGLRWITRGWLSWYMCSLFAFYVS